MSSNTPFSPTSRDGRASAMPTGFLNSDDTQEKPSHKPNQPPSDFDEYITTFFSTSDGRDKPLKVAKASLKFSRLFVEDFQKDPVTLRRMNLACEKIETARALIGLVGLPLEIRNGCHAYLDARIHFLHLTGYTIETPQKESEYEAEYPGLTGKILGLVAQIFKFLEKVAHVITYGICGFELFIESCKEGQVSQSAKAVGQKFGYFAFALHLCNFVSNLSDFIRKGFVASHGGSESEQKAWMNEMNDLTFKLAENICDLVIDFVLILSIVVMVKGYAIASLSLLGASVGLYRLVNKMGISPIIPLKKKPKLIVAA